MHMLIDESPQMMNPSPTQAHIPTDQLNSHPGDQTSPANFNPELAAWLSQQGMALALSTYRANRLIFLGVDAKRATDP